MLSVIEGIWPWSGPDTSRCRRKPVAMAQHFHALTIFRHHDWEGSIGSGCEWLPGRFEAPLKFAIAMGERCAERASG
jgi:hypothetical protein